MRIQNLQEHALYDDALNLASVLHTTRVSWGEERKYDERTLGDESNSFVLFDDKHLEAVSYFDVSLGGTGEGIGDETEDSLEGEVRSLSFFKDGRCWIDGLILAVDLVHTSWLAWGEGVKESMNDHVVEEGLDEGLG